MSNDNTIDVIIPRGDYFNGVTVKKDPVLHTILLTEEQLSKLSFILADTNICPNDIGLNSLECISDHCCFHIKQALLTANKEEVKP